MVDHRLCPVHGHDVRYGDANLPIHSNNFPLSQGVVISPRAVLQATVVSPTAVTGKATSKVKGVARACSQVLELHGSSLQRFRTFAIGKQ